MRRTREAEWSEGGVHGGIRREHVRGVKSGRPGGPPRRRCWGSVADVCTSVQIVVGRSSRVLCTCVVVHTGDGEGHASDGRGTAVGPCAQTSALRPSASAHRKRGPWPSGVRGRTRGTAAWLRDAGAPVTTNLALDSSGTTGPRRPTRSARSWRARARARARDGGTWAVGAHAVMILQDTRTL